MKKIILVLYSLLYLLNGQQIPYKRPYFFDLDIKGKINPLNVDFSIISKKNIFENVQPYKNNTADVYYIEVSIQKKEAFQFELSSFDFKNETVLFFIDKKTNGWVGPYSKKSFKNFDKIITGRLNTNNFLIELSTGFNKLPNNPIKSLVQSENNKNKLNRNFKLSTRQDNNEILLCGYWPPSNEGIRDFSKNLMLNPNGWIGGNWEERGFDIISYFPSFINPDCESCGQGYGDLEVDYQDTSEDWWNIVDSINPIAIITFSRGFIDYSWELEWQYFNHYNWTADFTEPFIPTPTPPDSTIQPNSVRLSNLPMQKIVNEIELANLGLDPYIDFTNGAGNYLSEFMGYHGVWQKAKMDSINSPCIVAGHVHVGGLIDWNTTRQGVEITVREVIKIINEYQNSPGDINQDGVISGLDILEIVDYIFLENNLIETEIIRADINFDDIVNVYDLLILTDIILELP